MRLFAPKAYAAYLLYLEAATPPLHRDALRQADADATVLTNVFTGQPARVLPNRCPASSVR